MKETKAQRLFKQNYYQAVNLIEQYGIDTPFDALHRIANRGGEYICRHTVETILAECGREERKIDFDIRLGIEPWKDEAILRKALIVVRNTCCNWIEAEAALAAI